MKTDHERMLETLNGQLIAEHREISDALRSVRRIASSWQKFPPMRDIYVKADETLKKLGERLQERVE
jgi:hypothetical protein